MFAPRQFMACLALGWAFASSASQPAHAACLLNSAIRDDIADGNDCLEAQRTGCVRHMLTTGQYQFCLRANAKARSQGLQCIRDGQVYNEYSLADCAEFKTTGCVRHLQHPPENQACLTAQAPNAEPQQRNAAGQAAPAEAGGSQFPVVFTDQAVLAKTGVVIVGYGRDGTSIQHTANKCYQRAAGLYDISVTNTFLARQRARGFSLQSLCMALHSGIRFDPDTGNRLPTFIVRDPESLDDPDPPNSAMTNEIPLTVPRCFAKGTPLTDCAMRFDPLSGQPLGNTSRSALRAFGQQIERFMTQELAQGRYQEPCSAIPENCSGTEDCEKWQERQRFCVNTIVNDGWMRPENVSLQPQPPRPVDIVRMIDVSDAFPRGFGYALYQPKSGGAPDPSKETLRRSTQRERYQTEASVKILVATLRDDR